MMVEVVVVVVVVTVVVVVVVVEVVVVVVVVVDVVLLDSSSLPVRPTLSPITSETTHRPATIAAIFCLRFFLKNFILKRKVGWKLLYTH